MTLFDLNQPIETGMPVYPGDPQVSVAQASTIDAAGANVSRLQVGSHTGTHLDAPSHVHEGGLTVDELDLALLHGPAHILHAQRSTTELHSRALQAADFTAVPTQLPSMVCLATGWDEYFHHELREQHPYLTLEFVELLWERGARVLGVDTLSPDPTDQRSGAFPVHEFWLGHSGVIVENLRGLTELPTQVHMSLLPLNLRGVDGSPIRAIAWNS